MNWHEASAWCQWLTTARGVAIGVEARLPAEAQWEYACRAATETEYYSGDGVGALTEVDWFGDNSGHQTHDVDERRENHPFGLYGMHGNVWEWCRDSWDDTAYRKWPDGVCDPEVLADRDESHQLRVLRGGSWYDSADRCRSAYRSRVVAVSRHWNGGLRVCLVRGPAEKTER